MQRLPGFKLQGLLKLCGTKMRILKLLFGTQTGYGLFESIFHDINDSIKLRWYYFKKEL